MQDFYPERLHCALMVDAPTLFWGLWRAVSPFIDEVTKSKVMWLPTAKLAERQLALETQAPLGQFEQAVGGTRPLTENYEASSYLAADPWRTHAKPAVAQPQPQPQMQPQPQPQMQPQTQTNQHMHVERERVECAAAATALVSAVTDATAGAVALEEHLGAMLARIEGIVK
jgi:hypothetical protein